MVHPIAPASAMVENESVVRFSLEFSETIGWARSLFRGGAKLKNSSSILNEYVKYVNSEPLIGLIDSNPLGVTTNLKQVLTDCLNRVAQTIRES